MENGKNGRPGGHPGVSLGGGEEHLVHRESQTDENPMNDGKCWPAHEITEKRDVLSYICLWPGCGKEYKEHAKLRMHLKNVHRRKKVQYEVKKIACEGCGAVFENVWKKNAHQVKCPSCPHVKRRKYACVDCCQYFCDESTFNNHSCDF